MSPPQPQWQSGGVQKTTTQCVINCQACPPSGSCSPNFAVRVYETAARGAFELICHNTTTVVFSVIEGGYRHMEDKSGAEQCILWSEQPDRWSFAVPLEQMRWQLMPFQNDSCMPKEIG